MAQVIELVEKNTRHRKDNVGNVTEAWHIISHLTSRSKQKIIRREYVAKYFFLFSLNKMYIRD